MTTEGFAMEEELELCVQGFSRPSFQVSQAEEARGLPALLALHLGDTREQGRASQTPETRRGQILFGGRKLPTHVGSTGPTLSDCPGVAEEENRLFLYTVYI